MFARLFSGRPLLSYSLAAAVVLFLAAALFWWTSNGSGRLSDENLAMTSTPAELEITNPVSNRQTEVQTSAMETEKNLSLVDKTGNVETTTKTSPPPPKKDLSQPAKSRAIISTIILSLGSTRDAEAGRVFVLSKKTVLVNLKLQFESGHFASYFAVVETADGQQIWRGKVPGSKSNNNEITATLKVSAHRLSRGNYVVSLKGLTKTGVYEPVADYSFTVDRR